MFIRGVLGKHNHCQKDLMYIMQVLMLNIMFYRLKMLHVKNSIILHDRRNSSKSSHMTLKSVKNSMSASEIMFLKSYFPLPSSHPFYLVFCLRSFCTCVTESPVACKLLECERNFLEEC